MPVELVGVTRNIRCGVIIDSRVDVARGGRTMSQAKPFPLNAWYAAAWSHEIKHELTARTICEKDVVLYRRQDGPVVALEDACWHRLLPLSMGRLKDDE